MSRVIFMKVMAITLLLLSVCFAAALNEPNDQSSGGGQSPDVTAVKKAKPRVSSVTIADFYLRDGNTVSARLLSDDKTQVVVEELLESKLVTRAYSKKEIDMRSFATRTVPEWKYYIQLGDYFVAQTWDFVDDPDDFIQAVRCYERAKQSLQAQGDDAERIAEVDGLIQKIKQDKEVWTSQVETRAKLKQFEYQAEAENRLKKLEKQIEEGNAKLSESIKSLDKAAVGLKDDYQRLEKNLTGMNKDFVEQIRILQVQINENRVLINELWHWFRLSTIKPPASGG